MNLKVCSKECNSNYSAKLKQRSEIEKAKKTRNDKRKRKWSQKLKKFSMKKTKSRPRRARPPRIELHRLLTKGLDPYQELTKGGRTVHRLRQIISPPGRVLPYTPTRHYTRLRSATRSRNNHTVVMKMKDIDRGCGQHHCESICDNSDNVFVGRLRGFRGGVYTKRPKFLVSNTSKALSSVDRSRPKNRWHDEERPTGFMSNYSAIPSSSKNFCISKTGNSFGNFSNWVDSGSQTSSSTNGNTTRNNNATTNVHRLRVLTEEELASLGRDLLAKKLFEDVNFRQNARCELARMVYKYI